jgi:hypothetical protein
VQAIWSRPTGCTTKAPGISCEPAMLVRVDGKLDSVYVCSIVDDAIVGIRVVRNPDKLLASWMQLSGTLLPPDLMTHRCKRSAVGRNVACVVGRPGSRSRDCTRREIAKIRDGFR